MSQFKGASKFPTKQGGGNKGSAPKTIPNTADSDSGSSQADLCSAASKIYSKAVAPSEARDGDQAMRKR
jgi:hypothetical protein